jgi:hypothetical protein
MHPTYPTKCAYVESKSESTSVSPWFQDLMKTAPEQLNVVEACNMEGRLERLVGRCRLKPVFAHTG